MRCELLFIQIHNLICLKSTCAGHIYIPYLSSGNPHDKWTVNCCFNCEKFRRFLQYEERFIYLDSMKCDGDNCNERLIKHSWKTTCYNCYIVKKEMARINFN